MDEQSPTNRLYRIVEEALCTGCGLCQSVAGKGAVRMEVVSTGYERPVVVGDLSAEQVDKIYQTCPGLRIEGLPASDIDDTTRLDDIWGPYQRMTLAHASDPDVRFRAATGGVLTALAQYLVESGEVAFVLHARPSEVQPTFGTAHVSRTSEDVLAGMGSRYGPTAPLVDISSLLELEQPFAFIGKPCDISALRNLARIDPRVDRLVRFWLTPVCGGYMPPAGMDRFLREEAKIDPDDVKAFRYRGYGCPGDHVITLKSGEVLKYTYTEFWGTDQTQWQLPFRCKICGDGIGEAADIAAADSWPGGSPTPETSLDDPGTNAIIIRTKKGADLFARAVEAGYLTETGALTPREMDDFQPHQVTKKQVAQARWDGLAALEHLHPTSAGIRLTELSEKLPRVIYQKQYDGARERVLNGKASEPPPEPKRFISGD